MKADEKNDSLPLHALASSFWSLQQEKGHDAYNFQEIQKIKACMLQVGKQKQTVEYRVQTTENTTYTLKIYQHLISKD